MICNVLKTEIVIRHFQIPVLSRYAIDLNVIPVEIQGAFKLKPVHGRSLIFFHRSDFATIRQGRKDQDNSVLCRSAWLSAQRRRRGGGGRGGQAKLRKRRVGGAGREVGNDRGRRRGRNSGCTWTICTVDLASRRATPTHTWLRARRGVCGSPRTYIRATCEHENVYALGSAYYSHSLARAGR